MVSGRWGIGRPGRYGCDLYRAVPCRQSVPKRSYGEMELARTACGVRETATPIMETCPAAYGAGDKLHFQKGIAATAMESIVEKALEEMRAETAAWQEAAARSAAMSAAHSAAAAGVAEVAVGKPWVAVVVCCGWNCNKDQGRAEAFVTAELTRCATWGDFVSVASGHAGKQHLKFEWLADRLGAATNHLWQTNKEDHEQAKKNKETLAQTFARSIVLDPECEEEVAALGGGVALQHYRSLNKASHGPTSGGTCGCCGKETRLWGWMRGKETGMGRRKRWRGTARDVRAARLFFCGLLRSRLK